MFQNASRQSSGMPAVVDHCLAIDYNVVYPGAELLGIVPCSRRFYPLVVEHDYVGFHSVSKYTTVCQP